MAQAEIKKKEKKMTVYTPGIIAFVQDTGRTTKDGKRKMVEVNDGYKIDVRLVPVDLDIKSMIGTNFLDY